MSDQAIVRPILDTCGSQMRPPRPTGKPSAALPQNPFPAPLAAATNPVSADRETSPEAVALTHELVEALTAIGNYLTAAAHIRRVEPCPPGDTLDEVLEKSLTQFTRAVEAVRRLRAAILSIKPSPE